MYYWTKDIVIAPYDLSENTWYVGVFSGWGGPPNGLGRLYRTTDRGQTWNRINDLDRVTSITFDPGNPDQAYLTTETDGLWHTDSIRASVPSFSPVASYPFRQPERVFFNPYNVDEVWVASFGNGIRFGTTGSSVRTEPAARNRRSQPVLVPNPCAQSARMVGFEQERLAVYEASGRKLGLWPGARIVDGLPAGIYFVKVPGGGLLRLDKTRQGQASASAR